MPQNFDIQLCNIQSKDSRNIYYNIPNLPNLVCSLIWREPAIYLFLLQRSSMCAFFFNILPIFYISFMHMTGEMSNLIRKKRFDSLANGRTRIFLFPVHLHLLHIISCSLGIYQSHTNLQNKFVCLYIMYLRLYQLRYTLKYKQLIH